MDLLKRTHKLISETDEFNIWMITWPPGTGIDWHDHGNSTASVTILKGELVEYRKYDLNGSTFWYADSFLVLEETTHKVVNESTTKVAISLHTYWPPLTINYPEDLEIRR